MLVGERSEQAGSHVFDFTECCPTAMEEHPDVVHSYFDLLSRVSSNCILATLLQEYNTHKFLFLNQTIQRCPEVFYQLSPETIENIFMFAVAGMGLQERLALQAALNFMVIHPTSIGFKAMCY